MFPQPGSGLEGIYGGKEGVLLRSWVKSSEDSFTLNVFGTAEPGELLPVLFWIYGGSLNNGSADKFLYDPTEWLRRTATEGKKFIVVTGNYRTNVFGFASSEDLKAADPKGLSGNYGLYDCVSQLEWIQANIANFGGDSSNVTIFGCVVLHSLLFQHLISPHDLLIRPTTLRHSLPHLQGVGRSVPRLSFIGV